MATRMIVAKTTAPMLASASRGGGATLFFEGFRGDVRGVDSGLNTFYHLHLRRTAHPEFSLDESRFRVPIPGVGMATITKKDLVNRIAGKTKQTKSITKNIIQMFLDEIVAELGKGNRLEFREFGVFEIKERAARRAQNPRTLHKVDVPAKLIVKFKVGRSMREAADSIDRARKGED